MIKKIFAFSIVVISFLSLSFAFSYRKEFLINNDFSFYTKNLETNINYRKMDSINTSKFLFNFKNLSLQDYNFTIFSTKKVFLFINFEKFDMNNHNSLNFPLASINHQFSLKNTYGLLLGNNFDNTININFGLGNVYRLKNNIFLDFDTSVNIKNFDLKKQNDLLLNSKIKIYIRF